MKKSDLLKRLRDGEHLSLSQLIQLTFTLSLPAILAQISTIVMEYIDASMVGHIGAEGSAAIGLVASSTWLFGGLNMSVGTGFTVQVAQSVGAGDDKQARNIMKTGIVLCILCSVVLMGIGVSIHEFLPKWLGGAENILADSASYFFIYALALPLSELNYVAGGMLQCSGNMKVPGILHIVMCFLDVIFNRFFIYSSEFVHIAGFEVTLPGMGLGVTGAALGTAAAEFVICIIMVAFLLLRSEHLHLRKNEKWELSSRTVKNGFKIALPVALEQVVTCGAQVVSTGIVAPLGTISVAANSLSVTAESFCYMPGYGISSAATTLIGQSIGAKREDLTRKLAWLITGLGMLVMTVMGILLFIFAPQMIAILSPDPEVQKLGAMVLRIEAFAEPFYAASIVATGVFRGAGDTLIPSIMNFCSMWIVRIPVAMVLAPRIGLKGVWFAMCIELCVRGILFLLRLSRFHKKRENC